MEQQKIKNKIWSYLDKLRTDQHFSGFRDTKLLELIGETFGIEKIDQIFADKDLLYKLTSTFSVTAPPYVFNLIQELLKTESNKSILDPWLTISSPMLYFQADKLSGICMNQAELETIKVLFQAKGQNFKLGDPLTELEKTKEKYDLVLSFPPFGMRTEHVSGVRSTYDFSTTLLLKCGELLNTDGKLIFLVSNSFLMDDKGKEAINNAGLFVNAVFSIPSGAFAPMTSISSNLIFVSRKVTEKTFVAEISQDETRNKTILQNFKNQKEGKAIQLGGFVDLKEFKSLNALISEKEMHELVKRIGYPPILLTKISISINALKGDNAEEVEHLSNSIYLPKVGNSPVIASLSELKIKPKNCYQIQLDETQANAIYVANYFNSQIGKKLRESLEVGAVIPQISKSQLTKCVLYLPDLPIQAELIEVDSKIQQFTLRLNELKHNLWKQPKNYKTIVKELKSINQEDKLENWIDTLPFPISSILWLYYATTDNNKKVEHLLNFFEAFAEFLSLVILSALTRNIDFYNQESSRWIKDDKFKDWYLRADFGSWKVLLGNLTSSIRAFINDKEKRNICLDLFSNPGDEFVKLITNSAIIGVLEDINKLRNDWKGHQGITPRDLQSRVSTLEQKLNLLRSHISNSFEEISIIASARNGEYDDGIYSFKARKLVGAKSLFKEVEIKTSVVLDKKKLYLITNPQYQPIELFPFIKYQEEIAAIYFYSKIESSIVHWISYHFDIDPNLDLKVDNDLLKAFDYLKL